MRRYMAVLGLAFAACAIVPAMASAQVVIVGRPAYYPPVTYYSAPPVVTYSALTGDGIAALWDTVLDHRNRMEKSG